VRLHYVKSQKGMDFVHSDVTVFSSLIFTSNKCTRWLFVTSQTCNYKTRYL